MYGKIFTQMYEGTLASKGPWEALITFQQLIVLANKHGEVDMTPEAIARRTTIPLKIIKIGLRELQKPDNGSRTPDEDGKRIVLLDAHRDWGWKIVNYEKYSEMRSEEERREYFKLYKRKYRADKKAQSTMSTMSTDVTPVSVSVDVDLKEHTQSVRVFSTDNFRRFWEAYPNKLDEKEANKAWMHIPFVESEAEKIMAGLEIWKNSESWKEPRYIPCGAKFLSNRRWETLPPRREGEIDERRMEEARRKRQ